MFSLRVVIACDRAQRAVAAATAANDFRAGAEAPDSIRGLPCWQCRPQPAGRIACLARPRWHRVLSWRGRVIGGNPDRNGDGLLPQPTRHIPGRPGIGLADHPPPTMPRGFTPESCAFAATNLGRSVARQKRQRPQLRALRQAGSPPPRSGFHRHQHFVKHLLRVAKEHAVVFLVEEWIVHPGVT